MSADESFKPIIDAEVQVYEANHPARRSSFNISRRQNVLKIWQ